LNYRKFYRISGAVIAVFTLLWLVAFVFLLSKPNEPDNSIQSETTITQPVTTAPLDYYLVRSHLNNVAIYEVYTNGAQSFIRTLEIDLSLLRAQDKAAFDEGIILKDKQSLASLIEDFTS